MSFKLCRRTKSPRRHLLPNRLVIRGANNAFKVMKRRPLNYKGNAMQSEAEDESTFCFCLKSISWSRIFSKSGSRHRTLLRCRELVQIKNLFNRIVIN